MKYLERRVIHGILLLIGVSVLCFLFSDLAPGSFFDEMKLNPEISAETVAGLRSQYGLDQPLPVRYGRWVKSVSHGDWGFSFAYNMPVKTLLVVRARNTLFLTTSATFLAWLIAIPLGVWIGSRGGGWEDRLAMAGTSLLLSVPELVLALGLLYWVVRAQTLPVGGMTSVGFDDLGVWAKICDLTVHIVVPATILVLASLPILVRHVRASMVEVLKAPFIQAARGHGIGRVRLLFRHALPAAANPLISLFGLSVAGLLSGSLLVEVIIGWPGLGPLLLEASISRDVYVVVGAVMASTLFMILGSFLADVMLVAFDPRLRME
ncbi:MAG TPA: ABC transporter permease [Terriglobales bacterium]|jgi:peptide/nickel transport system permease protein|nr:ABC transporter permease [Terriglobales bacterium]